jgi:hypothetical protein
MKYVNLAGVTGDSEPARASPPRSPSPTPNGQPRPPRSATGMSEGFARRSPRATEGRRREEERLGDRARRPPPVRPGRLARPEAARAGTGRPSSRHRRSLRPARAPNATDPTQADRGTPDVRSVADTRKRLPDRSGSSHTLACRRVTVAAAKGSRAGSVPVRSGALSGLRLRPFRTPAVAGLGPILSAHPPSPHSRALKDVRAGYAALDPTLDALDAHRVESRTRPRRKYWDTAIMCCVDPLTPPSGSTPRTGETVVDMDTGNTAVIVSQVGQTSAFPVR